MNQLNTSGRVRPVATWPSTPPTDWITGLAPAARTIEYPGVITSESPATQSRSFFFGVNASLGRAGAGVVGAGTVVVPPVVVPLVVVVPGVVVVVGPVVVAGGNSIAVSISSAEPRPMALWSEMAWPVEQQRMAHVRKRCGERERDVALRPRLPVEGGLVHPGCRQQSGEHESERTHDERVARGREASSIVSDPRRAARRAIAALRRRRLGGRWAGRHRDQNRK